MYKTVRSIGVKEQDMKQVVLFVLKKIKKTKAVVSLHCVGDQQIRSLNRRYRKKDKVTDVLSFPMRTGKFFLTDKKTEEDWGDIFICIPQIKRQAKEYGVSYKEELYRMTVHGVLHLLGYDHEAKKDATIMFPLQDMLVAACMKKK